MTSLAAVAEISARTSGTEPARERTSRQTAEEIKVLKARDNSTNWIYLARIYVVLAISIVGAIYLDHLAM